MEYYGYAGRTLFADLSGHRTWSEPLDPSLMKKFVGGPGFGFELLARLLKPGVDPLSPEAPIVAGLGAMGGTLVPGSGRCFLAMKYPVTADRGEKKYYVSNSTGGSRRFGAMLKNAGYDQMVITGRADKPSYLLITDEGVEIRDAKGLWGLDIHQTNDVLLKRHGGRTGKCGVWAIGPAGENLVRIAQATLDNVNSLGRNVGAVLGSKNLKAVVTLGRRGIQVADRKRFLEVFRKKRREILDHPHYQPLPRYHFPIIQQLWDATVTNVKGCVGCLGACRSTLEVRDGRFKGESYQGGDVSVPLDFGRRLRLDDYGAMFKLIDMANRYGLCMLTTTRMIHFVTRLFERGEISLAETGGLSLRLGDVDCYMALMDKILHRQDIGEVMGQGWHVLNEHLGVDADTEFRDGCSIIKGVDSLTDSRFWPSGFGSSMGLANIVHSKGKHAHGATYWPQGPDLHQETYWPEEWQSLGDVRRDAEKMGVTPAETDRIFTDDGFNIGRLTKYTQDAEYLYNALGLCDCVVHWECDPTRDVPWLAELFTALTGIEAAPRDLLRAGERNYNLEKLLNVREGFSRSDDKVPEVWRQNIETPLKLRSGDKYFTDWFGNRLSKADIERMLDDYYLERGWDVQRGGPTDRTIDSLGLSGLV